MTDGEMNNILDKAPQKTKQNYNLFKLDPEEIHKLE